jgi:nitroreductase
MVATMDVFEAVDSRISCRRFLNRPVDPKIVRDLIARAARAASGGNLQPWQVYALTGTTLAEVKRRVANHIAGHDPRHDDAEYPIYPATMWFHNRYYAFAILTVRSAHSMRVSARSILVANATVHVIVKIGLEMSTIREHSEPKVDA